MSQRTWAAVIAGPLVLVMLVLTAWLPLPYAVYSPGSTVDVLDAFEDRPIVEISGHRTHRPESGALLMTTVVVTRREQEVSLLQAITAWLDDDSVVVPHDVAHREGGTPEQDEIEGEIQMVSSQDTAIAVALRELGHDVTEAVEVVQVGDDAPALGRLQVRDRILAVNGEAVQAVEDVTAAVEKTPPGEVVRFRVRRQGDERTVPVVPVEVDGAPRVGITVTTGYLFPFEVTINISESISGPSAGLIFALAVYDNLTPGDLTRGGSVAGTGALQPDGEVLPIGGIDQKIAGARDDGADLFLVPPGNCPEVAGADAGDMRLVMTHTVRDAIDAVETWAERPTADLPTCDDLAQQARRGADRESPG